MEEEGDWPIMASSSSLILQEDGHEESEFPVIEWIDGPPSHPSYNSQQRLNSRAVKSHDPHNPEEWVNDISYRLHTLSLDHQTLHRSMAFMANLSSLDGQC
jgi:hypothetical protein